MSLGSEEKQRVIIKKEVLEDILLNFVVQAGIQKSGDTAESVFKVPQVDIKPVVKIKITRRTIGAKYCNI